MPPAVDVRDLRRRFGTVTALDGATWSAASGAVTAVLGPNGAGKTTMVACGEGLERPDSGTVRVLGTDPWRAGADHRARVGVMLQQGGLPNGSRPLTLLRYLSRLYSDPVPLEGPSGLSTRLGIDGFAGTPVRRLSGGERQRVALAAALVGRPEVVFLDEPTAGLDPHARLGVWDLVRETADGGAAVIMTTHSFEEAGRLADHIVIVAAGRVVAAGPPADLTTALPLEDLYFSLTRPVAS